MTTIKTCLSLRRGGGGQNSAFHACPILFFFSSQIDGCVCRRGTVLYKDRVTNITV